MTKKPRLVLFCLLFCVGCLILSFFSEDIVKIFNYKHNDNKCDYCTAISGMKDDGTEYCGECWVEYGDGNLWD